MIGIKWYVPDLMKVRSYMTKLQRNKQHWDKTTSNLHLKQVKAMLLDGWLLLERCSIIRSSLKQNSAAVR